MRSVANSSILLKNCLPLIIVGAAWCGASVVPAQDGNLQPAGTSPLGIRQQRVERLLQDLDRRFKTLILSIREKEPERAERLQQTLNRTKELLLEKRMTEVTRLLDQSQLELAGQGQLEILTNLRELMDSMLRERTNGDEARQRLELLGAWKKEIQKLTLVQREEQTAAARLAGQRPMPPSAVFDERAKQQRALATQSGALAQQMAQPASNSPNAAGNSQPGQQSVAKAQQAMLQAGSKLGQQDATGASSDQQKAIEELEAALGEIEGAMQQLQAEAELESLAKLAALFGEMLATQQRLTTQTAEMEIKRTMAAGQVTRADRNMIRVIGEEERRMQPAPSGDGPKEAGLAGKARQASEQLASGGVNELASVVSKLQEDFVATGNLLADELRTDGDVARRQHDLAARLAALIEVLKKSQAAKQQALSQAQAAGGNQPGPSGSSAKQSQQQAAQGGKQGGGSKGIDGTAAAPPDRIVLTSPWSQLRDKERDPVYSAIKEKFPARYQQLIEQYYRSFADENARKQAVAP
jgi:hypothetical protein